MSCLITMGQLIEDYALIGDTETAALVGRDGSIDWFCAPRFDSAACFAALLGDQSNGRWQIAPRSAVETTTRRYRNGSLVLETEFVTETGTVAIIDFMPIREGDTSILRIVECRDGVVAMGMELIMRFDYGNVVPWVRRLDSDGPLDVAANPTALSAIAGADGLVLYTPVRVFGHDLATVAEFDLRAGDRVPFELSWHPSFRKPELPMNADHALVATERWWRNWASSCTYEGRYADAVHGSLRVLKALTFAPTGGIVAAPTTSLPEWIGSVRNWDYRYCWLRDATFTLDALSHAGHVFEALAWSMWLRRAVAGSIDKMQIMYGVAGERRLNEVELPWLAGYEGSAPVRIGNGASDQFQLDVYGEVMDMLLHSALCLDQKLPSDVWKMAEMIVEHVERVWMEPDDGIWEVRGPRQHFVHSKVMAWVAVDRWVQLCYETNPEEDLGRWRKLRDEIHEDVCTNGWNDEIGSFTQAYGSRALDASLLMLALVGFLPADDPRIVATVEAIERDLVVDGFVLRYQTEAGHDGLPPGEGAFLLTTFWLVDNLVLMGRIDEATDLFERLLGLCNDVGLLAEEYDPVARRQLGNFPQAFSHVGLIISAANITKGLDGPSAHRCSPISTGNAK